MWWAAVIGYGALALMAVAFTWRDPHARLVGCAIALGYLLSNGANAMLSLAELPAALTVVEVLIATTAFVGRETGGSRWLVLVVAASLFSSTSNVIYSWQFEPSLRDSRAWIAATNVCFVIECLAAITIGVTDRAGRAIEHLRRRSDRQTVAPVAYGMDQETDR